MWLHWYLLKSEHFSSFVSFFYPSAISISHKNEHRIFNMPIWKKRTRNIRNVNRIKCKTSRKLKCEADVQRVKWWGNGCIRCKWYIFLYYTLLFGVAHFFMTAQNEMDFNGERRESLTKVSTLVDQFEPW